MDISLSETAAQPIQAVCVVVLNWNGKDDTFQCVESILAQRRCDLGVVIVDNGSTDDSVAAFRNAWGQQITIIEHSKNVGFAAGMNVGIRHALDIGYEWVFILNNDTMAASDMLAHLLADARRLPAVGILSPAIYHYDDPDRIWRLGDRQYCWLPIPLKVPARAVKRGGVLMVDYVPGCAMLVRRSVFEAIGLFDERLFMYFEDADLCRRAIEAGFGIACVVSAKLWHKVSQSAVRMKVVVRYQLARNRLLFFRRYAHGPSRALTDVYLIADGLIRIVRAVCAGSKEAALADWRGLVDGWRLSVDELREA